MFNLVLRRSYQRLKAYKCRVREPPRGFKKKNFFGMDHPTFVLEHFHAPTNWSTLYTKQAEFKAAVMFPLYARTVKIPKRKLPRVKAYNLFSHILNRYITVDVSVEGADMIDNAGGIDNYLLKNDDSEFRSEMGVRLKEYLKKEVAAGNDWRDKQIEIDEETGLKKILPTVHWVDLVGFDENLHIKKKTPRERYRCLTYVEHKVEIDF